MDNQPIDLSELFADLKAIGKPVSYESIQKRIKKECWLPAPFTPAVYTREIETPLLNQGWRQDGIKLLPPRAAIIDMAKWKPASTAELRRKRDSLVNMLLTRALEEPDFDVRPYTPLLAAVPPVPTIKADKQDRDVLSNLSIEDIQRIAAILIAAKEKSNGESTE